jgi:hypothetical protein
MPLVTYIYTNRNSRYIIICVVIRNKKKNIVHNWILCKNIAFFLSIQVFFYFCSSKAMLLAIDSKKKKWNDLQNEFVVVFFLSILFLVSNGKNQFGLIPPPPFSINHGKNEFKTIIIKIPFFCSKSLKKSRKAIILSSMKASKLPQKSKVPPTRVKKLNNPNLKPAKIPTPSPLPDIPADNYPDNSYYRPRQNLDEWDVLDSATPTKPAIINNYDSMLKRYNINRGSPPLYVKERKVSYFEYNQNLQLVFIK